MFHTLKHGSILEKAAAETEQEILHVHQQIDQKSEQNEWRCLKAIESTKSVTLTLIQQLDMATMIWGETR